MFKDVYKAANKKISIKSELMENTENKIKQQLKETSNKHKNFQIYRRAALPVCLTIVLCLVVGIPHILSNSPRTNKPAFPNNSTLKNNKSSIKSTENSGNPFGSNRYGVQISPYYRYNGNYYLVKKAYPEIQNNISRHLYDNFYEIKGVDTMKSIALFVNGCYYQLDYAFNDTVIFNGKSYLINAGCSDSPGKYLGEVDKYKLNELIGYNISVDKYKIYELGGSNISEAIIVRIGNKNTIAYQYPSSIKLNGINYELDSYKNKIGTWSYKEEYIGMAGSYKAYKYDNIDITKRIMIHINNSEEVTASATTITDVFPLPVSKYGGPEESMYPLLNSVQWKGHGLYSIDDKIKFDSLNELLGKHLSTFTDSNYNYELFQMNGEDTSKCIIVKNNQVYFKYRFSFPDTINFNGHTYIKGVRNANQIKGNQIGTVGANKVYEFKGIDPSKSIDIFMSSSMGQSGDFTFYRQDN